MFVVPAMVMPAMMMSPPMMPMVVVPDAGENGHFGGFYMGLMRSRGGRWQPNRQDEKRGKEEFFYNIHDHIIAAKWEIFQNDLSLFSGLSGAPGKHTVFGLSF
jgi:hypothetical protein